MSNAVLLNQSPLYRSNPNNRNSLVIDSAYKLLSTVGRGRNSVVYKGLNLDSDSKEENSTSFIAIKVLLENSKQPYQTISRLKSEAEAMIACDNEHVVALKDFIANEDTRYLVMEYAALGDLHEFISRNSCGVTKPLALKLILQILEGLNCIHEQGIIHCDLKPENIFVFENQILKIGDFSLALLPNSPLDPQILKKGLGTFEYLAPECLAGKTPSPASDIYSVGIILFQLLTGQLPFPETSFAKIASNKIKGQSISLSDLIPNVNGQLKMIVKKALASKPEKRFKTAKEFSTAIKIFLNEDTLKEHKLRVNWDVLTSKIIANFHISKENFFKKIIANYKTNLKLRWGTFLVTLTVAILLSNSAKDEERLVISKNPKQISALRTITYSPSNNQRSYLLKKAEELKAEELKLRFSENKISNFNKTEEAKVIRKLDKPSLKLLIAIRESKLKILKQMAPAKTAVEVK